MENPDKTAQSLALYSDFNTYGTENMTSQHSHRKSEKAVLTGGELFAPLAGIFIILVILLISSYILATTSGYKIAIVGLQALLIISACVLLAIICKRFRQDFVEPLAHLRNWIKRIRDGNLTAQFPVPSDGKFATLADDVYSLAESIRTLNREMDEKVQQQTENLRRKTHTLGILYDVAASSNNARSLDDLLKRYLNTLSQIFNAKIATARLITDDNKLRIVGCVKYLGKLSSRERNVPIERCLCAQNFAEGVLYCKSKPHQCASLLPDSNKDPSLHVISMPLQYQNRTLGIYNFFVEDYQESHETDDLLDNIGQHLSLAIEKVRLDDESKRISIMQERTMLAHELHDSLAQTLASLKMRITMLLNSLGHENVQRAIGEALQLKNGLDEANSELRELLSHFRVHMDERGLIPATEALIDRFRNESGISTFFQNECTNFKLPPNYEVQVLHIIQESLTNIRKHSKAEHVRVLLRCDEENYQCHVLIEDDGKGIGADTSNSQPGENVGLNIMRERAERIHGDLSIDSEPGEGTRIELDFSYMEPEPTESTDF